MRRRAKVDANQPAIVLALRQAGAIVQHLHTAGAGVPDLLVGYRGINYLLEVKDENAPRADQVLTVAQVKFHDDWRGQVAIVKNATDALRVIGAIK